MIESWRDVRALRETRPNSLNLVELDGYKLLRTGLLRFAAKYAIWATRPGHEVRVSIGGSSGFGMPGGRLKAWQVRSEAVVAAGRTAGEVDITLEEDGAYLTFRKRAVWTPPLSVEFGYLWSGSDKELPHLREALDAVESERLAAPCPVTCTVAGVQGVAFPSNLIEDRADWLRTLQLPDARSGGRILIGAKKAALVQEMEGEVLVVAHARIAVLRGFVSQLLARPFEVAAPRVWIEVEGKRRPYLDYILVDHHELERENIRPALLSEVFGDEPLTIMRGRRPYIDGGITLIDGRVVRGTVFPTDLAWGEAEDVWMCSRLWQEGVLVDYLPEVQCMSLTSKFATAGRVRRVLAKIRSSLRRRVVP